MRTNLFLAVAVSMLLSAISLTSLPSLAVEDKCNTCYNFCTTVQITKANCEICCNKLCDNYCSPTVIQACLSKCPTK